MISDPESAGSSDTRAMDIVADDVDGSDRGLTETADADDPTPAASHPGVPGWQVFAVITALLFVVACLRLHDLFSVTIHEDGDVAVNSLSVIKAEHFDQFVGNYSRVGFHHPGPALFYLLAAGQAFFHGLLHVVPGPTNGQYLAAVMFACVAVGLCTRMLYRMTRSLPVAGIAAGAFGLYAVAHGEFVAVWFPYLYIAPFLIMIVSAAAVASGRTSELPWLVLAGSMLVQGHISFVMFVGLTLLVVIVLWLRVHRETARTELGVHRRALWASSAIIAVFALPMVVDLILHFPGQWPGYIDFIRNGQHEARTLGDCFSFFYYYVQQAQPVGVSVAALIVAAALIAVERGPERRRVFGRLYTLVAVETLFMMFYIVGGVDDLIPLNRYVGYFYESVPVLLTVAAGAHLVLRVTGWLGDRGDVAARGPTAVAALVAVALVAATVSTSSWRIDSAASRPYADYPQIVRALRNDPARAGRQVELRFSADLWPLVAGVGIQATRTGLPWCVPRTKRWVLIFGSDRSCPQTGAAQRWQVYAIDGPARRTADDSVIWERVEAHLTTTPQRTS